MNRPDFTVASLSELVTLHTADIAEGANVWVDADGAYWTLEKNSGASLGPGVVAPLAGAPSAGATNARWLREAGIAVVTGLVLQDFTANASLVDHADQFVAPGNCVATTLAPVRPYVILPVATQASSMDFSYQGDAANVAGETVEIAPMISTDFGSTWTDIPGMRILGLPTNLTGFHGVSVTVTPQLLPAGTFLSLAIHPSAALSGVLKNLSVVVTT